MSVTSRHARRHVRVHRTSRKGDGEHRVPVGARFITSRRVSVSVPLSTIWGGVVGEVVVAESSAVLDEEEEEVVVVVKAEEVMLEEQGEVEGDGDLADEADEAADAANAAATSEERARAATKTTRRHALDRPKHTKQMMGTATLPRAVRSALQKEASR